MYVALGDKLLKDANIGYFDAKFGNMPLFIQNILVIAFLLECLKLVVINYLVKFQVGHQLLVHETNIHELLIQKVI